MTVANNKHNIDFAVGGTTYGLLVKRASDPVPIEPWMPNMTTAKGQFTALTNKMVEEWSDWSGGMGQDRHEQGSGRYKYGTLLSHIPGHLMLAPPVTASATNLGAVPLDCVGFAPSPLALSDNGAWTYSEGDGAGGGTAGDISDGGTSTYLQFSLTAQTNGHWAAYLMTNPYGYGSGYIGWMQYILTYVLDSSATANVGVYYVTNSTTYSATTGVPAGTNTVDYWACESYNIPTTGMGVRRTANGAGWTKMYILLTLTNSSGTGGNYVRFATVTSEPAAGAWPHYVLTPTKVYRVLSADNTYDEVEDFSTGVTTQLYNWKGWLMAAGGNDTPIRMAKDPAFDAYWTLESNGQPADYMVEHQGKLYIALTAASGYYRPVIKVATAAPTASPWALTMGTDVGELGDQANGCNGLGSYRWRLLVAMRDGIYAVNPVNSTNYDYDGNVWVTTTTYEIWKALDHSGSASAYIGSTMATWRGRLYYNANGDVMQYNGNFGEMEAEARNIGPVSEDRTSSIDGSVVKLLPTTNNLLAALDNGSGVSRVLIYNGKGWHPLTLGSAAARITVIWRDPRSERLYFNLDDNMQALTLPDTDSTADWLAASVHSSAASGTTDFARWDAGFPSLIKWLQKISVTLTAPVAANTTVVLKYKLNGAGSWTTLGTLQSTTTGTTSAYNPRVMATGASTYELDFVAGSVCYYADFQIGLTATSSATTPDVLYVGLHYQVVGPKYYSYRYRVRLENDQLLRDGTLETVTIAQIETALRDAYASTSPISFTDEGGTARTVRLTRMQPAPKVLPAWSDSSHLAAEATDLPDYVEYDLQFDEIPA